MRKNGALHTVLLVTPPLFLLFPASIVTCVLERIASSYFRLQTVSYLNGGQAITVYGPTSSDSDEKEDIDIYILNNLGPTISIFAIAIVAFCVSVIGVCGMWELRTIQGKPSHQRKWTWVVLITHFLTAMGCIAILIYASMVQGQEGWKRYEDVGKRGQRFTRETWACQINKFFPDEAWAGPACGLEKASRFMLIPTALAALLVLVTSYFLIRERGGMSWLFGGKGRYAGFDNVWEMGPGPVYGAPNQYAPNQYAPNQYAPNQYAPNQYAPNQYAPNQYAPNQYARNLQQPLQPQQQQQFQQATQVPVAPKGTDPPAPVYA